MVNVKVNNRFSRVWEGGRITDPCFNSGSSKKANLACSVKAQELTTAWACPLLYLQQSVDANNLIYDTRNQLKRLPQLIKSCRLTGKGKYPFLRVIGLLRTVLEGDTHAFQVQKFLYMIDKIQDSNCWHNGKGM